MFPRLLDPENEHDYVWAPSAMKAEASLFRPLFPPVDRLSIAMRCYSEAVKADVRRRISPLHRQSVAQISAELGIHVASLYNWSKTWRLQGEVVPASEKYPEA